MTLTRFHVGQIIHHTRANYRGVIYGVDLKFSGSSQWYEQVALSRPPKDKPWYHVLVDKSSATTYVAERHLVDTKNKSQIDHPLLGEYFNRYDSNGYLRTETQKK